MSNDYTQWPTETRERARKPDGSEKEEETERGEAVQRERERARVRDKSKPRINVDVLRASREALERRNICRLCVVVVAAVAGSTPLCRRNYQKKTDIARAYEYSSI